MDVERYWLGTTEDKELLKNSVKKVNQGFKVFDKMKFFVASETENIHINMDKLENIVYLGGG